MSATAVVGADEHWAEWLDDSGGRPCVCGADGGGPNLRGGGGDEWDPEGRADTLGRRGVLDGLIRLWGDRARREYRWLELVAGWDKRGWWALDGFASPAPWLAARFGLAPITAREKVRVARALRHWPMVRSAFADGELAYAQVRAITRLGAVPEELESLLVEVAPRLRLPDLEWLVRRLREHLDPDAAVEEALARRERRHLWLSQTFEGTWVLDGRLDPEEGELLRSTLDWLLARRAARSTAHGEGTSGDETDAVSHETPPAPGGDGHEPERATQGDRGGAESATGVPHETPPEHEGEPHDRGSDVGDSNDSGDEDDGDDGLVPLEPSDTTGQRRADALMELCAIVGAGTHGGTDPGAPGTRATVFVIADHDTLTAGAGTAELLTGATIPAATAQRLACDGTITSVTTHDSEVLDLGRTQREPSPAQRRAVLLRDRRCRWPGCNRRIHQIHHIQWWSRGGCTDLACLCGTCFGHHHLLHEGGFEVRGDANHTLSFHRPDGTLIGTSTARPLRTQRLRRRPA